HTNFAPIYSFYLLPLLLKTFHREKAILKSYKKKPTLPPQCPFSSSAAPQAEFIESNLREHDLAKTLENLKSISKQNCALLDERREQHHETTAYYTLARKIPALAIAAEKEFLTIPIKIFREMVVFRSLKNNEYVIQKRWGN
uniref:Uncharacterized protein n=1 Tax=Panagrolaimus sp. PS1159 TaxID=55785 RepID=A0AC35FEK4_9BILA